MKKIIFSATIVLVSLFLCSAGCETIASGGGGGSGSGNRPSGNVPLTGIEFADANISIAKDTTHEIATVAPLIFTPANATNKKVTYSITANSYLELVDGTKIKGVANSGAQTVTLTATSADGNRTATCQVKVTDYVPLNDISLTTDKIGLNIGESTNIASLVIFDPPNASNKKLIFDVPSGSAYFIQKIDDTGNIKIVHDPDGANVYVNIKSEDGNHTKQLEIAVSSQSPMSPSTMDGINGRKVVIAGNQLPESTTQFYAAVRLVAKYPNGEFRQGTKNGMAYPKDFHLQLKVNGLSQFLLVRGNTTTSFSQWSETSGFATDLHNIDTGFYFGHEFLDLGNKNKTISFENVVIEDRSKPGEFMGYPDFARSNKVSLTPPTASFDGSTHRNIACYTITFEPRDDAQFSNVIDKVTVTFDGFVPKN